MDQLEEAGVVSVMDITRPREVLMSDEEFNECVHALGGEYGY